MKTIPNKKLIYATVFIYAILLIWFLLFKCGTYQLFFNIEKNSAIPLAQRFFSKALIPFYSTGAFLFEGYWDEAILFVTNLLCVIPLGFFLAYVCNKKTCILLVFLFIIFIETTQCLAKLGGFDTTDIIMNFAGGIIGIYINAKYSPALSAQKTNALCKTTVIVGAIVCVFAVIYTTANFVRYA